jgi:hypothetical protein
MAISSPKPPKPPKPAPKVKPTGRKTSWPTKIDAPPEALALYEMISSLQHSTAFKTCHPYQGATSKNTGIPMFKFEGRVHAMPYIICSFMGIEYGTRNCKTYGCMNPFHYSPPPRISGAQMAHIDLPMPTLAPDYHDLLEYYVEEVGIQPNYTALRAAIPTDDISDAALRAAVQAWPGPGPGNETL